MEVIIQYFELNRKKKDSEWLIRSLLEVIQIQAVAH